MVAPIEVHASPASDQLWAALRQLAPIIVTFALARGWIDNDMAILVGALAGVVWPLIAGQLKTRLRAQQLAAVANVVSDSVAVVK
jgi:ABC-type uncharacterized transport system permease subunit